MTRAVHRRIAFVLALLVCFSLFITAPQAIAAPGPQEDVSNTALTGEQRIAEKLDLLTQLLDVIEAAHLNPPDKEKLLDEALKGMFRSLDPWSEFLTADEYKRMESSLNGEFGGIGVTVELRDGILTVVAPIPGTPAARAGLRADDQIVAVNGESTRGLTLDEASRRIQGDPGTNVTLTIRRSGEEFTVELTRELIHLQNVKTEMLDGGRVAYIQVNEFSLGVSNQVTDALTRANMAGNVDGVILDLRNNPGGLLDEAVFMLSQLLPADDKPAVIVETRDRRFEIPKDERVVGDSPRKLVVLVNESSASASELVAAAVQDAGAGVVVGTRTYGKGTVQEVYPLRIGGAIKLTVARYLTAAGRSVDGTGVVPDIIVEQRRVSHPPIVTERTLRSGIVGLDVLTLEETLRLFGFDPGEVDGVYDSATAAAVAQLQMARSLDPTGVVNSDLVAVLNAELASYDRRASESDAQLEAALKLIRDANTTGQLPH